MRDFLSGARCAFKGCNAFFCDRKTWRYAIVPFLIMLVFYALAIWVIFSISNAAAEYAAEAMQSLPDWLAWLASLTGWIIKIFTLILILIFPAVTICAFYEFFGGFFFDSLTEYYEKTRFGIEPAKKTFAENLKYAISSVYWGIGTVLICGILFLAACFVPVIGPAVLVIGTGYCFGISYMISSAGNNRVAVKELLHICRGRKMPVLGFGLVAYFLLSIPFAAVFFIPGLVLGGSELFNSHIKK